MVTYVGIDIGGMTIKGIVLDEAGKALCEGVIETGCGESAQKMCENIAFLVNDMLGRSGRENGNVSVGIGCPGCIDSANGIVLFAGNLGLNDFPLKKEMESRLNMPVRITNDANAAALGEARFGAGKDCPDSVLITLGTGVGGGVVIGGRLYEGYRSAGTELGHTVIVYGGEPCTCGRRGCFEAYCSATALMRQTRRAMEAHPESKMWERYTPETVSGRTPFEYAEHDEAARQVTDEYIKYLACGIINMANIFRPGVVMLGGGVSRQGERLTAPLQKLVDEELFAGTDYAPVKVKCASLGNRAGAYGAAALFM